MAIVENRSSEIGDIMRIKTDVPVVGIVSLYSFLDSTDNETATRLFTKEFRYSIDGGFNFTEWEELSSINLTNISIDRKDLFVIEYKYERSGTDVTDNLAWNNTVLQGEIDPLKNPIYNRSIFKKFFEVNDSNVLGWALNVLEKLYKKGIIPEYVTRNDDEYTPIEDDKDFLNFFNVTTHFFAIIVYYARQYRDLKGNALLTREFILSRGLVIPFDEDLTDMIYLLDNYVSEYRNRGTYNIINKKSDGSDINGELVRLINYLNDEFIFGVLAPKNLGWCLGISSPMWSSCKNVLNLVKAYEFNKDVEDLSKYPLTNGSYIDLFADGDLSVMRLSGFQSSGINTGISQSDLNSPNEDYLVKVDPSLDYEISFKIKKITTSPIQLTFNLHGYDENGVKVNLSNSQTGSDSNNFISSPIDLKKDNIYHSFRGVLFNESKDVNAIVPMFENGANLRLKTNIKSILPEITVSDSSTDVYIYDIKILPLNLPFTQGQLGVKSVIVSYLKNNGGLSDDEVKTFIERYLIPYDHYFTTKFIN